jgi:hypothetical protein
MTIIPATAAHLNLDKDAAKKKETRVPQNHHAKKSITQRLNYVQVMQLTNSPCSTQPNVHKKKQELAALFIIKSIQRFKEIVKNRAYICIFRECEIY